MSYTLATHVARLVPVQPGPGSKESPLRAFALIDAAQLTPFKKPLQHLVPGAPLALLFEESFAKSGLELSPVLFELEAESEALAKQILALDAMCKQLPVMSILHSPLALDKLTEHLRSMLLIEADDTAYLLRFADSQMLAATNSVLTPSQRARFFNGLRAWFTVDYRGRLNDAANAQTHEQTSPIAKLPLKLDATQTDALLAAAAIPTLTSQVRNLEATFREKLTHAQQTEFIVQSVAAATDAGIAEEPELIAWTLQRWQNEQGALRE